jgi:hypothetical protein
MIDGGLKGSLALSPCVVGVRVTTPASTTMTGIEAAGVGGGFAVTATRQNAGTRKVRRDVKSRVG